MLNKYYELYELIQDILKISAFNDQPFSYPILADHKLIGMLRKEGYLIGIYSESLSMNVFSLQTQSTFSCKDFKASSVNTRTKSGGSSNIQNSTKLDVYSYKTDLNEIELSNNINLSTGEGSDEIFQFSTIHPDVITDCWAIISHYKNHGISNLYHLGWTGHLPENVIDMMIQKLQSIKEELQ